ncbi:THUMP domain-containing protein [Hirschfeldia incana]|nr:THUMP domain-containing protein [Hirschfeldia incana]
MAAAAEEEVVKDVGRSTEEEPVGEKREREEEAETLAPWEQHASIISIPRFDYTAPSSLLHHSHSGFLVTCGIKREKSATKEVMSILGKVLLPIGEEKAEVLKSSDASKRQKLCAQETVEDKVKTALQETGENSSVEDLKSAKGSVSEEHKSLMSLVKLTKSGLLLFTFPAENSTDTTDIVSRIFQFMESGALKAPVWCHRIFPVQATCSLTEKELQETVSKLVQRFVDDKQNTLSKPVKFAAAYSRRGVEETKGKIQKASEVLEQCPLLDRTKCFETVAAGVKAIVPDSVVDLKSPELCVLVELLPLSRIPNGSYVAAVSVLPHKLVSTKPKLVIKPLVAETKQKKGQN